MIAAAAAIWSALVLHGPNLLVGVTIVLAGGLLVLRHQRNSEGRRRVGVWTMLAAAAYLVVAAIPFPRLVSDGAWMRHAVATNPDLTNPDLTNAAPTKPRRAHPTRAADTGNELGAADGAGIAPAATVAGSGPGLPSAGEPRAGTSGGERWAVERAPVPDSAPGSIADGEPAMAVLPHEPNPSTPWPWRDGLLALTLAIAALLLLHYAIGALRLFAILRRATRASHATHALAPLPRRTRVVFAATAVRPFCAGILRPVIVLSPELAGQTGALAAVLRHEAAHLRARDPLVQTLFALLALPLAIHPLFWWLRSRVRFESERLADERAAGGERTAYARQLLNLVDDSAPTAPAVSAMAIFHRRTAFYRRIQMLLQPRTEDQTPLSRTRRFAQSALLFGLVATAASAFGVEASAQNPTGNGQSRYEAERAELEAEIAALKRQIRSLSKEVTRRNDNAKASDFGTWKSLAQRSVKDPSTPPEPPPPAPLDTAASPTTQAPNPLPVRSRRGQLPPGDTAVPTPGQAPGLPPTQNVDVRPALHPRGQNPATPSGAQRGRFPAPPDAPAPGRMTPPDPATAASPEPTPAPAPSTRRWPGQGPAAPSRSPRDTPRNRGPIPAAAPGDFADQRFAANNNAVASEAIVALTSRMLDLNTEVEIAKQKLEETKALANNSMVSQGELRREMARLANLERKRKIVRGLVDGEMKATKLELTWLRAKMRAAPKSERLRFEIQRERAEGRLDALRATR